ncbi:MAG TPA: serine/threonine-protein kinase [Chloroflexota bacterium]|nr:serine/threonine-protein kinase [Chloroflexota bacterium]
MQQASVMAPEGQTFGPYRLWEVVGRGALTVVYRAEQPALRRWVAVKLLPPPVAPTEFPARFVRAAEDWARLEHPHVLALHDYGQCQGQPFLVTPFVDGGSLDARLAAGMPRDAALGVLLHVCGALAYAHRQRVIHGAVTPSSVLLRDGHGPALADFGLARLLEATGATPPQGVFGTPEYLAPEQARGAPIDARADVYALGIILYRILAGVLPFTGASAAHVLALQRETPWRPLELPRPEASRVWNAVLVRALAKAPNERYPTAEALAAAIQAAMRQEQALTGGSPSSAVLWQPVRPVPAPGPSAAAHSPGAQPLTTAVPSMRAAATAARPAGAAGPQRAALRPAAAPGDAARRAPRARTAGAPSGTRGRLLPWLALGAVLGLGLLAVLIAQSPGVPDSVGAAPHVAAASDAAADAADADAPADGPAILLQDDFADPNSGWPRQSSDLATRRLGYVDGEYSIVKVANSPGAPFVSRDSRLGDFLWEMDTRLQPPTDNAYAYLDFRRQDNGDHYSFIVDPNDGTFRLERAQGQSRDELVRWTPSAAIRRGTQRNRLGVRAEGATITLLANGEVLAQVQDDKLSDGGIAFGVGNFRNGAADGRFDNLLITALGPS